MASDTPLPSTLPSTLPATQADGAYEASQVVSIGDANEEQIVTLYIGTQCFGLPISQVQDIVEPHRITPVPQAPPLVRGVLNLRGRIVTVLDLRVIFGHKRQEDMEHCNSISIEYEEDLYALLVDRVGEVLRVPRSNIMSVPGNLDPRLTEIATGIVQLHNMLVVVIDVEMLMRFVFEREQQGRKNKIGSWLDILGDNS